jgi:hypothetical protein
MIGGAVTCMHLAVCKWLDAWASQCRDAVGNHGKADGDPRATRLVMAGGC